MKLWVITLFPDLLETFFETSLIRKARNQGQLTVSIVPLREFADPPHFRVDDSPYGGGAGMVMKPEPLAKAIEWVKAQSPEAQTVLFSPRGETLNQNLAQELSIVENLVLICPRYEGVDQRVIDLLVDREISLGDYILMGGDVAAMATIEATVRLIPGIIGNSESLIAESFSVARDGTTLLEAPHYTRPPSFRGLDVPEILLSGNHQEVEKFRHERALEITQKRRPQLLLKKEPN